MHTIRKWRLAGFIVAAVGLGLATVVTAHEQRGGYSAGEPGNPRKPAREIVVLMNEMDYTPAGIEVKRGEQIHLVLRHVGTEAHGFLLATTAAKLKQRGG